MSKYDDSQVCISMANRYLMEGNTNEARASFKSAADIQWEFVESLADDKVKTRSIYGLSAASLYYRAHELAMAEHVAFYILSKTDIEPYCKTKLKDLLSMIWDEQLLTNIGEQNPSTSLELVLRQGRIGYGRAPVDIVERFVRSILSFGQRVASWMAGISYTSKENKQMGEMYRAYETPAIASSYKMSICYTQPAQLSLEFPEHIKNPPTPNELVKQMMVIMRYIHNDDIDGYESLINDAYYRLVFTKLLRNIMPNGKDVGEVELRCQGEEKEKAVILVPYNKQAIDNVISITKSKMPSGQIEVNTQKMGILRAVDLDNGTLRLDTDSGKIPVTKTDTIPDDVIGPMLNKRVKVTGSSDGTKIKASDIELHDIS